MKRYKILALLALILGIGAPFSVIAADVPGSSTITNYIQNARTPEDHEHIASLFDAQAVRAQSIADGYADMFVCQHSQATILQKRGVRFPGVTAQRHCRRMLRHYSNQAKLQRALADHHRDVADHWRANSR
jgi:hypothetical protein